MSTIRHLLRHKGNEVWSIGPAQSVYQAIDMMAAKGIGALTVVNDKAELVGLVSERDYARKVILKGKSSKTTHIADIMTTNLVTVIEDAKVNDCMTLMTHHRIRHLPVLDGGELVGMISIGDLVRSIISEQDYQIEQLERYVRGEEAGSQSYDATQ